MKEKSLIKNLGITAVKFIRIFIAFHTRRLRLLFPIELGLVVLMISINYPVSTGEWIAVGIATLFGFMMVNLDYIAEFNFKGGTLEFAAKMKELDQRIDQAKLLASLSVRMAAEMTLVPQGRPDGGAWDQFDALYRIALKEITKFEFSDKELNDLFKSIDHVLAKRLYLRFIYPRLKEIGGDVLTAADMRIFRKFNDAIVLTPDEIHIVLEQNGIMREKAVQITEEYQRWYRSSRRLENALQQLGEKSS